MRLTDKEVPRWVEKASKRWILRFARKYGHNPYDQRKTFVGKTFVYKVEYPTVAQGVFDRVYYKKRK